MIIDLSENWRVVTGNLNFELQEQTTIKHGDNKGKPQWVFRGYYSGLQSCFNALPDHLALSPSVQTFEEYMEVWRDLSKQITARFRK